MGIHLTVEFLKQLPVHSIRLTRNLVNSNSTKRRIVKKFAWQPNMLQLKCKMLKFKQKLGMIANNVTVGKIPTWKCAKLSTVTSHANLPICQANHAWLARAANLAPGYHIKRIL